MRIGKKIICDSENCEAFWFDYGEDAWYISRGAFIGNNLYYACSEICWKKLKESLAEKW